MPRYEEAVKLWQSWNIQTEADLAPLVTFLEAQTVKTWSRFLAPPAGNAPPRKGLSFFMQ